MKPRPIYHLHDRTMKYMTLAQTKRQHQYLKLPGEFKTSLPREVVYPDMDLAISDSFYCTDEGMLVDLEEESVEVTEKTLKKFAKYVIFAGYRYSENIYLAVLCHKDPKKDFEYFKVGPSLYIKVHYYYFPQDELWNAYENLINKVQQKERLTEREALDIAFLSKFISDEHATEIIESLTEIFKDAIIEDKILKMDVGAILGAMIIKHIKNERKKNRLLEMINMRHIENEIDKLVYDEYGEELDRKDKEIAEKNKKLTQKNQQINQLNQSNTEYKNRIKQLNELEDLNTPKAKQIIKNLMLL